jgi:maltooligosyltrehalose synthase
VPLDALSEHACAFARVHENDRCLVIVPRLVCTLFAAEKRGSISSVLGDAVVSIGSPANNVRPAKAWQNIFTGEVIRARDGTLRMEEVFATFPLALLTPEI